MKPRIPIDNCPHEFAWDDVAEEEYCVHCGLVNKEEKGGWLEPDDDDNSTDGRLDF